MKCHQYWPNSGANIYGNTKVKLNKEQQFANYCLRQFVVEQVAITLLSCAPILVLLYCRLMVLRTIYV